MDEEREIGARVEWEIFCIEALRNFPLLAIC